MTVSKRMTINPVTCTPDMGVLEVYEKMKEEGVRRLPVLDSEGNLVGVISEANILNAATEKKVSLLGFAYELAHLSVGQIMSREVITVNMDDPVEQAARKMSDFDVTILPVVNYNGKLVGVVTRSDMFKLLLELFGTRHYGIRVSFTIDDKPGTIAKIASALEKIGANIISIGNLDSIQGESTIIMKVSGVDKEKLGEVLKPMINSLIDIREA